MTLVLQGSVQPSGVQAVQQLIDTQLIGSASYFAETESTNSTALNEIRCGAVTQELLPKLYLADRQTAGRGRHGRTWLSEEDSLTFSLVMQRTREQFPARSLWPIAIGVAIARSIEFCFAPLRTKLKWPNDVYIDGGKVAGILLETTHGTPETVVIGIGVNTNMAPRSSDIANLNAQSIATVIGREINRYELLLAIIDQVIEATQQAATSPQEVVDDYRSRCLLSGHPVSYQMNSQQRTARCCGINDLGELLLESNDGVRTCNTGEVNLVRLRH